MGGGGGEVAEGVSLVFVIFDLSICSICQDFGLFLYFNIVFPRSKLASFVFS